MESGGIGYSGLFGSTNDALSAVGQYMTNTDIRTRQLLESLFMALTGHSYNSIPSSLRGIIDRLAPGLLRLIPGYADPALLFDMIVQQASTAGVISSTGGVESARKAHEIALVAQNILFTDTGMLNTLVTRGLSGLLAQTVLALAMGPELMENNYQMYDINLSGEGTRALIRSRSGYLNNQNFSRVVEQMMRDGQIYASDYKYYLELIGYGDQVVTESAIRYAFLNDGIKIGDKIIASKQEFDSLLDDKKREFIQLARKKYNSEVTAQKQHEDYDQVLRDLVDDNSKVITDINISNQASIDFMHSINNGTAIKSVFKKDDIEKITKNLQEAIPVMNENVAILSKAFNTLDFEELQRTAKLLNLGSLTSKLNAENIRANLNNAYAMAAASNRSIESVLTERKALTQYVSALEGGDKFVSNQHVINLLRIRNLAAGNEAVGAFRTLDEETHAYQRSYDNAYNNYGQVAAMKGLMNLNPGVFSTPEEREEVMKLYAKFENALKNGDTVMAETYNKDARRILDRHGINEEQKRYFAKNSMADITLLSAKAGASGLFYEHLVNLREKGGARVFDNDTAKQISSGYNIGTNIFGSNASDWATVLAIMENDKQYSTELAKTDAIMKSLKLSPGFKGDIAKMVHNLGAGGLRGLAEARLRSIQGGQGQAIVGENTIIKENLAWIKQQMEAAASGKIISDDQDPASVFFTSLMSTDSVITPSAYLNARVREYMQEYSKTHNGEKISYDKALDKLKEEDRETFGDVNYIGRLNKHNRLSDNEIKKLAKAVGVSDVETFKKHFVLKDGSVDWQSLNSTFGTTTPISIGEDGRVFVGGANLSKKAGAAAADMEKLGKLDFAKYLKGDNKITEEEVTKLLGEGNFKGGKYTGPIEMFKGMSAKKIEERFGMELGDGRTFAQHQVDRAKLDDSVSGQILKAMSEIGDILSKICAAVTSRISAPNGN